MGQSPAARPLKRPAIAGIGLAQQQAKSMQVCNVPSIRELIEAIEAHLAAHPAAADSAEGVARWWLGPRGLAAAPAEAEAALDDMARRGDLRRVTMADGNTLYCGSGSDPDRPPRWRM
jgi:hypothetical protein